MKRKYLALAVALALSLALVLAAGIFLKEAVLRPLGLGEGTDPATLPLRLLGDKEFREVVRDAMAAGNGA